VGREERKHPCSGGVARTRGLGLGVEKGVKAHEPEGPALAPAARLLMELKRPLMAHGPTQEQAAASVGTPALMPQIDFLLCYSTARTAANPLLSLSRHQK
jgi:hypothetical protein